MKKIGLFGGCFNPPSKIHINLANNLIANNYLDKVIFVPVGDYYSKKELVSAENRYNMLKLAIKGLSNLEIDDIILTSNKRLYATDSFKILAEKYKSEDIYFIMGSDNFAQMPNWKEYELIINQYKYIVIERENYNNIVNQKNIIYYQSKQKDISATKIRVMIKNNQNVENLLDSEVFNYIQSKNLYN